MGFSLDPILYKLIIDDDMLGTRMHIGLMDKYMAPKLSQYRMEGLEQKFLTQITVTATIIIHKLHVLKLYSLLYVGPYNDILFL